MFNRLGLFVVSNKVIRSLFPFVISTLVKSLFFKRILARDMLLLKSKLPVSALSCKLKVSKFGAVISKEPRLVL